MLPYKLTVIQKLVSLLHVKLPSELQLVHARASLFRITFILDFGVPQILIEVDGLQIRGRVSEVPDDKPGRKESLSPASPPRSPDKAIDSSSDYDEDEQIPDLDYLAKSFVRDEPAEEIREIKAALETQSQNLQESFASSDGDSEYGAGVGVPLGVPDFFKRLFNTALDRLRITVNNIDIEVEDQLPPDGSDAFQGAEDRFVSLNFHVDRIEIDSVTPEEIKLNVVSGSPRRGAPSGIGRRRMRIEKIYTRLISDADNFKTMSRVPTSSRSSSPVYARSVASSSRKSLRETVVESSHSVKAEEYPQEISPPKVASSLLPTEASVVDESVLDTSPDERNLSPNERSLSPYERNPSPAGEDSTIDFLPPNHRDRKAPLSASTLTDDEDRFADATSDDGLPTHMGDSNITSSVLYDEHGFLRYDIDDYLEGSGMSDLLANDPVRSHYADPEQEIAAAPSLPVASHASSPGISHIPLHTSIDRHQPLSHSLPAQHIHSTDNLDAAMHHIVEQATIEGPDSVPAHAEDASPPHQDEDLAESKIFTHDEVESMYLSAMSAGPGGNTTPHVPGGWQSSSPSSQGALSDMSGPIPDVMYAGSVLVPLPEPEGGCETPRPSSRQSAFSTPHSQRRTKEEKPECSASSQGTYNVPKLAKLFLTVDEIIVWFPLGLDGDHVDETAQQHPEVPFSPVNLTQDSIFQDVPGSFSHYAFSTSSRNKAPEKPLQGARQADARPATPGASTQPPDKSKHMAISVEVGTVVGRMDVSTGRIMYQLLDRVVKAMTAETQSHLKSSSQKVPPADNNISLNITVKVISISWLERLMAESMTLGDPLRLQLDLQPLDVIMRVHLSRVHATSQGSRSKIQVGKFVLSSLDSDIISFVQPKRKSRRSTGTDSLQSDIEIDLEQGTDLRVTVATRPVKVVFDLEKLDDALSSFGGFSGILELGSSISSASTATSPTLPSIRPRPRGVQFIDAPPPPPAANTPSRMPKIQVQIGDVTLLLKGKSCAVQLQTSTVRAAIRQSNVRLKVAEVKFSGPHLEGTYAGAPLMVDVMGVTVNFLFTPEEADLTKLISMITPSKDPYENNEDILVEILLRQRRKGSVLRVEVESVGLRISDLAALQVFESLGSEVAKFAKVTKYLPEDDRPGILTLALVRNLDASVSVNDKLGDMSTSIQDASVAHVGVPPLFAFEAGNISIRRDDEVLLHEVVQLRRQDQLPMIMMRVIGDEVEPLIKAKLFNVCAEYRVSTLLAALGLSDDGTPDEVAIGIASSIATITGLAVPDNASTQKSDRPSSPSNNPKPLHIDLLFRSCALGLNPRAIPSKALFVLTDAHILGKQSKKEGYSVAVGLRKASIHAIDDTGRIPQDDNTGAPRPPGMSQAQHQLSRLRDQGYVSLGSISEAKSSVKITGDGIKQPQVVEVEFKNELFVLESCADSTQTLIAILSGLSPPRPPSTAQKYRTVVPLQEMMESFTGDAMAPSSPVEDEDWLANSDRSDEDVPTDLEFVGSVANLKSMAKEADVGDVMLNEDDLGTLAPASVPAQPRGMQGVQKGKGALDFNDDYFRQPEVEEGGTAKKWNSKDNKYHLSNEFNTPDAPLRVMVRDVNVIWNLFDGYDWPRTRDIFKQAVDNVEARAEERRQNKFEDDDEDFVEQDFLFNSVWIGVPVKDEQGVLARRINRELDDTYSETGSYATSTATRSTGATVRPGSSHKSRRRRLRLERSKNKKIAFDLAGISVDLVVYPPNTGETQNSLDVRIHDFTIYDHVPSSTWNKFVTCLIEKSKRELVKPMIRLEVLTVKPVVDLAASELVMRATILPLRLHVDQDALDFITRFFEFKDDSAPSSDSVSEEPFIQRLEVMAVVLKLDYKPKRVDYRGLRSGHTTEFMNFLILEGADIVLRHAIVYGLTSFEKLHKTLNDVWMPDVQRNQLPHVLSGLAAVRPLVNVGSGMRDLVVVPMREYKKDGRLVRSLQKGVYAFAKNTTSSAARLGAKVAIGTQNLLEGAENFLSPQSTSPSGRASSLHDWENVEDAEEHEQRAHSNYAHQPLGVKAGLRSAARHLERDLLTAKDAVIAIPAEIMEEGTGVGMARAIARRAPTVILRPALGATKAVSNALLGVGNALDGESRRKIGDVSGLSFDFPVMMCVGWFANMCAEI